MQGLISAMQVLEEEYQRVSGLANRSSYKIFYGLMHSAPILVLGLNPAGDPEETSSDGTRGAGDMVASSSGAWYEGAEHDLLDCDWPENFGLRRLLMPLVQSDAERFRGAIVKTNLAFRRSRTAREIDIDQAIEEARPFVDQILEVVDPTLVILTGVKLSKFLEHHVRSYERAATQVKDPDISHVVFDAAWVTLSHSDAPRLLVQVDHASQFSWTYERYGIPGRILTLLSDVPNFVAKQHESASGRETEIRFPLERNVETMAKVTPSGVDNDGRRRQLQELLVSWQRLGIERQFTQVHHFSSPKFATRASGLKVFVRWCADREIRDENYQTLLRGLDVARSVEHGELVSVASDNAWRLFPLLTR